MFVNEIVNETNSFIIEESVHLGKWIRVSSQILNTTFVTFPEGLRVGSEYVFENNGNGTLVIRGIDDGNTPPTEPFPNFGIL